MVRKRIWGLNGRENKQEKSHAQREIEEGTEKCVRRRKRGKRNGM